MHANSRNSTNRTMSGPAEGPKMPTLLPELLTLASTHMSWIHILSARATCVQWAAALAPLVTQLRIPLVAAPDAAIAHVTTAIAPTQAGAAAGISSASAAVSVIKLPKQLSAALSKFHKVHTVTLLLTPNTTGSDLQQALQIVGSKAMITTVSVCEVGKPAAKDKMPRAYVSELKLSPLVHVTDLTIRSLSWSLASIWKQVGALRDALAIVAPATDNSGGSSSSDTAMPPPNSSSGSSSNTSTPPATTSNGAGSGSASSPSYALRSLTVENVPHNEQVSVAGLSCNLEDHITQLPAQIIQLTTPLPGQYNKGGKVVCALNASHEGYLRDLAAGLPQLLALTVLSPYEGREEVFEGFEKLQELHCELGDAFRSHVMDFHMDNNTAPSLRIATMLSALTRLDLLPQTPPRPDPILTALGHSQGVQDPFKLDWLQHNKALQHLAAPLIQTGQDLESVSGQLRSLTGQCMFATNDLLQQVFTVGAGLTSLVLYQSGPDLAPRTADGPFRMVRTVPVAKTPNPLSNLHTLCLMANKGVKYVVPDPPAFWAQFPALHSLKLQNVCIGYQQSGDINPDRAVEVVGAPKAAHAEPGDRTVLWLKDLPCQQLQRLELSRYYIVFHEAGINSGPDPSAPSTYSSNSGKGYRREGHSTGDDVSRLAGLSLQEQRPAVAAAAAQEHGTAAHVSSSSSSSGRELLGLEHCALVDCSFLLVPADQQDACSINTPHQVLSAQLMNLLARIMAADSDSSSSSGSKLRSLKLNGVDLGFRDVAAVLFSGLALHLEELEIQTQSWISCSTGTQQQPQQVLLPDLAKAIAAAAQSGGLRKLRRLSLCIEEPPPPASGRRQLEGMIFRNGSSMSLSGLSVLAAGCQLRSLQELRLSLTAEQDGELCKGSGWCACRTSSGLFGKLLLAPVPVFAGPWQELLRLRNLRKCDIKLQCYESKLVQSAPHIVNQGRAAVVGVCVRCGGAVSVSDLRLWMRSVAAAGLSGCQVNVDVMDCSPETKYARRGYC